MGFCIGAPGADLGTDSRPLRLYNAFVKHPHVMYAQARRPQAFTLVELLVVVAIIALLLTLLAPSLTRVRVLTQQVVCHTNNRSIMTAVNVYTTAYRGRLPFGTRTWPWMGMLDVYEKFLYERLGRNTDFLHCPSDPWQPGGIAVWWRNWYGVPMKDSDHIALPPGRPGEVDYTYYYYVKMYWGIRSDGHLDYLLHSWTTADIVYPHSLIVNRCFYSHSGARGGIQSGFIDGRAEWVDYARIYKACDYGDYNLDWTWDGIRGKDLVD